MLIVVDVGSHSFRAGAFNNGDVIHTEVIKANDWNPHKVGALNEAQKYIETLIQKLEKYTERLATRVVIVLSDASLKCEPIGYDCTVTEKEVTQDDLNHVENILRQTFHSRGLEIMHFEVVLCKVDHDVQVDTSVGLKISRLNTACHVVYQDRNLHMNWQNTIKRLPKRLADNATICTGSQVAQDIIKDKKECVAVVDIGELTKIYIFNKGCHVAMLNLAISADDLTANIGPKLGLTTRDIAKIRHIALQDNVDGFERLVVQSGAEEKILTKKEVFDAMFPNIEAKCNEIRDALNKIKWGEIIKEFIFIGGGSTILNRQLMSELLKSPIIIQNWKTNDKVYGPEWSAVFGVGINESNDETLKTSSGWYSWFCKLARSTFTGK